MCWNKEVSIITYVVVMVMVIILYRRNVGADRHIAAFSAIFVIIQLLEFFAWLSIEKKNRKLNGLVTRLILIALFMQPLVNSYMAMRGASNPTAKSLMAVAVIVFVIILISSVITATSNDKFSTTKGPTCHLVWNRTHDGKNAFFMSNNNITGFVYLLGLVLPVLFIKPLRKGVILAALGLFLMIISKKMSSKEEFSSWWCWIAGVFTLAAILLKAK
jgi:hypothetical protein